MADAYAERERLKEKAAKGTHSNNPLSMFLFLGLCAGIVLGGACMYFFLTESGSAGAEKKVTNAVDSCLDDYERMVEEYEEMASRGKVDIDGMNRMSKAMIDLQDRTSAMQSSAEWTSSQKKRVLDLMTRGAKAAQLMADKNQNSSYGRW